MQKLSNENQILTLREIAKTLADARSLRGGIERSLVILRERENVSRSFVIFADIESEELSVVASEGLSVGEFRRLENQLQTIFVLDVIDEGQTAIIGKSSRERLVTLGENESLLLVPILMAKRTFGALCVVLEDKKKIGLIESVSEIFALGLKTENEIAAEKKSLAEEISRLQTELRERFDFSQIIGNSNEIRQVLNQAAQVSRSNATVLICGETGTGKELFANAIHYNSLRSKKPFVKINCVGLPENVLESEFFGEEKKKSAFLEAEGGTILIAEVADLSLNLQAKLVEIIAKREISLNDSKEKTKTNFRLIATTRDNLEILVSEGRFDKNLFDLLKQFTIFLPPLHERKSDILPLAEHFLEKFEIKYKKRIRRISTPAIDMLMAYHFPANVSELENVIEKAVAESDENAIHGHHLPPSLQTAENSGTVTRISLETAVEAFEKDVIQDALKTTRGNRAKAAELLDTTERIINYKIKKYGLNPNRFRQ